MSACFVVELEIANQEAMEPYRTAVGATIEQYGGRFLVRAGATELIEGGPEPKRIVILEFVDKAAFKRWPGRWEVAVAWYNKPALSFWRKAIRASVDATVDECAGGGDRWRGTVLCFDNRARKS